MTPFVEVLYGSHARGQDDHQSDIDILRVVDETCGVPPSVAGSNKRLSISEYKWDEFTRMQESGAPFLAHLRADGRIIGGDDEGISRYRLLTEALPPYKYAGRDLASFMDALSDVNRALVLRDSGPEFEAATIATVIRHASILGCYLLGTPRFGRHEPTSHFCNIRRLPMTYAKDFPLLYQHRIALARGYAWPSGCTYIYAGMWLERARVLIREVANVAAR